MIKIRLYDEKGDWLRTLEVDGPLNQYEVMNAIRTGLTDREKEYYLKHYPNEPWHDCCRVDFYGTCEGCKWRETHKPEFKPSSMTFKEYNDREIQ